MDPTLKDNVLIPDDLTEYIYHIGNVTDMHSITNSGPIPGGKRLRKERQCVFFTAVNSMDEHRFPENARHELDKARIVAYNNEWKVRQTYLVQPETCSQERNCSSIKPDRTQSSCSTLHLRFALRKVEYRKTGEDLYSAVYKSPTKTACGSQA